MLACEYQTGPAPKRTNTLDKMGKLDKKIRTSLETLHSGKSFLLLILQVCSLLLIRDFGLKEVQVEELITLEDEEVNRIQ
jgi:hypothetical protein